MTVIRDFFRQRRVRQHVKTNGWKFDFHGIQVEVPKDSRLALTNALIKKKYESEEAELISRYLPSNMPVLELGGSLGIVSSLIGKHLDIETAHFIVEANPNLIEICSKNMSRPAGKVLCKAVSYNGSTANFEIKSNPHASMISNTSEDGTTIIKVEATTLTALWKEMGSPRGYTLVADIEGAEVDMITYDTPALSYAGLVIIELHPHLYLDGLESVNRIKNILSGAGFSLLEKAEDVYVWQNFNKDSTID